MSEIKVNKISPRTACGTTTLGDSGDTFTIPAGVTITNSGTAAGFGATGAASWDTTVKTSSPFTAVSGVGYFVNTTAGAITVNLPAGTAGDVVAIKDYANTFDTNNVTLVVNGSDKIGGLNVNGTLSTEGLAVTLVFVDATQGWLVTDSGLQTEAPTALYVTATGGTPTTSPCGDYKIHTFTGPGTFCVSAVGNASGSNSVDYLVVAGGGSGGGVDGNSAGGTGGGGAGGTRFSDGTASGCYAAGPSPLSASALPVSAQPYTITVGGGASAAPNQGASGGVSTFSTITSTGGGGGGGWSSPTGYNAINGGSGGGGTFTGSAGVGNTPPVSPPQGNTGGASAGNVCAQGAGGGGGATAVGAAGGPNSGGNGGDGVTNAIRAACQSYGGGGGGGVGNYPAVPGKTAGDGGTGGGANAQLNGNGVAGTVNTGGGGSGTQNIGSPTPSRSGGAGGSGIVIIRYKFQN